MAHCLLADDWADKSSGRASFSSVCARAQTLGVPVAVGRVIVATVEPHEITVFANDQSDASRVGSDF